ncbi:dehydrogenase [Oryctes borbonicus]|uniref:Dehydrogenase n=1 Tax=Oryctes borbonicus TaxID=1629725 RepID=A0A0T6BIA1_9SCAR|nr:dehydrogenase [Oryctes borbonicus]
MNMSDLKDKVAIVTGASSGIGAGVAKELLQSGMKVVGLARRKAKVEELGEGYEGKLFAIEVDVTKTEDILRAFKWTQENVGPVYVLVNNAGISHVSPIGEFEIDKLEQVLQTNLLALTICTKEAVRSMKANNVDGFIININSVAGHNILSYPGLSIYTTSKHGVTAFTESIRWELANSGSQIRISSLSPGLVESEMTTSVINNHPHVKSEDIGKAVKYIITQPAAVNITELTVRPTGEVI